MCLCVCVCAGGLNPLLLNSLFGGVDLSSLQSLQSFQLAAGLMAFPPPSDPKQAATMLPLMLPGMGGLPNMAAALPNMFGLGGLLGGALASAPAEVSTPAASSGSSNGSVEVEGKEGAPAKRKREAEPAAEANNGEKQQEEGEAAGAEKEKKMEAEGPGGGVDKSSSGQPQVGAPEGGAEASINGDAAALLAAAGMSANSLAFNPFLLSTMAPGLLYPSMFLPPGLGGLSLPGFPTPTTLAELQSAMAGALASNMAAANATRHQETKGSTKEVEGGGESDLGEEKEEEVDEGGVVEEEEQEDEEAATSLKDKSD